MALSDYKFCNSDAKVEPIKNCDSFSVLIGGKIACSMGSGGAHKFNTELQAQVFGNTLKRGWIGGTYLSEDVDNFIITKPA